MLFSYCIPYDDGAAPNPFWGVCTLAICKPVIRRTANVGDWVVGTGSMKRGLDGHLIYAMKVSSKMAMDEYDDYTRQELPGKIPDWTNPDHRRHLGDSIYDFTRTPPALRPSVHGPGNIRTDLGGEYVLLSDHFYYFGGNPPRLPNALLAIVKQGQGHRSWSNERFEAPFVTWLESLGVSPNIVHGQPAMDLFEGDDQVLQCARQRCEEAETDELLGDQDSR